MYAAHLTEGVCGIIKHEVSVTESEFDWYASGTLEQQMREAITRWEGTYGARETALRRARINKYNRSRRERKRSLDKRTVSLVDIGERDGWSCVWASVGECAADAPLIDRDLSGMEPFGPTIEHIIPIALGGTNATDNLAIAHRRCNVRQGARGKLL